ncbi:DUF4350 domain-containing protein [Niabella yanshanensis]|uniref:DUF4350 domain-containing protein n=1 Tax=Niabella yanshanensis TaxID=577386 RepID=A0ABZ0W3H1_9BACT|nr:DUF4350 domain-containing protein [Niabella yanshanensis]WQD37047.1 DUF4350 domain-containing protein [Niabella yanshanensis]
MKKALPYILTALLISSVIIYLVALRSSPRSRKPSLKVSLDKRDKNPYGAFVLHESLKKFFSGAEFKINYNYPGDSKIFGYHPQNQLYVIVQQEFFPQDYEIDDLINYIQRGNSVFISTLSFNTQLSRFIRANVEKINYLDDDIIEYYNDSMQATISTPPFNGQRQFSYPGSRVESFLNRSDSSISEVLGHGTNGEPNLIHLQKGNGHLYVHTSPIAFSNYFLLYDNNIQYFEKIFSLLSAATPAVIWDEYFKRPHAKNNNKKQWFSFIMKNNYFRAGVLTALALLLIYTLTEFRRRQRVIPVINSPTNDTLEFVKTMGLLYYERGDHGNLAQKMSAYFMEHVRSRYKIFAQTPDQDFVKELSYKSGVSESLIKDIVLQIGRITNAEVYSDTELIALQKNIESFHNNE